MEEKKRPWGELFAAAVWGVVMYLKLQSYLGVANTNEVWQKLRMEYLAMVCVYGSLGLLSLLRFFLYRRKNALAWSEAIVITLVSLLMMLSGVLSFNNSDFSCFSMVALWILIFLAWSNVWRSYHNPK